MTTHTARPRENRSHVTPASVNSAAAVLGTRLVMTAASVPGEVLEHRAQIVVGRRQRADRDLLREHGVADLLVAAIRVAGLDEHGAALEHDACDVIFAGECRSDRARLVALDPDAMGMAI